MSISNEPALDEDVLGRLPGRHHALVAGGQHGAYLLLIAHYWNKGELISKHCYNIARAMNEQDRSNVDEVLEQFFSRDGDRWVSRRVEQELSEAVESYRRRAEAGSKGGSAKSGRDSAQIDDEALLKQSSSNASAMLKQPEPEPEPEPETSTTSVVDGAGPTSPSPSSEEKPAKEKTQIEDVPTSARTTPGPDTRTSAG